MREDLAGWPAKGERWLAGRPVSSAGGPIRRPRGRFLACEYELALGRQEQAVLAPNVLDDNLALALKQRRTADPSWHHAVRGERFRLPDFGCA